jgi:hypothetical protein
MEWAQSGPRLLRLQRSEKSETDEVDLISERSFQE